jgi:Asp-tRNA(Asn)/Glu-tRNA(Gln) amidotransferase A subunit family amidase
MSVTDTLPDDLIIERLRANLRAAGIAYTEVDIEAIAAAGLLARVESFEELVVQHAGDSLPDYLGRGVRPHPSHSDPSASPDAERAAPPQPISKTGRGDAEIAREALSHRFPFGDQRSLVEVAALVRMRAVSPVELVTASLETIARSDSDLNAFQLVLADQALAMAHEAEQEIMDGTYRGPLHGIPVAVKDLLAMAGTSTTAGSRGLANWGPTLDATAVTRLKQAGAVIVGKTRMSEFAYWPGSSNPHYGPTKNPWNLAHDTGGSSSGSGAAVASGAVFGALGTDTGGSIRIPAANCGIVGLKPTFGRASLFGAVPLSWSLDHIGPMTRTVADAAVMLEVLSGADAADPRTVSILVPPCEDIVAEAVKRVQLGPMRIGVLGDDGSASPLGSSDAIAAWHHGLAVLERCGGSLVPIDVPELHQLRTLNNAILAMEAAAYHEAMLTRQLDDFGSFVRARLLSSFAYGPTTFVRAQQRRALLRRQIEGIFEHIDVLCTPSMPGPAPALNEGSSIAMTAPFNALGWPAITVPIGWTDTLLPLGLQLVARPWDETTLLQVAAVLEAAQSSRKSSQI